MEDKALKPGTLSTVRALAIFAVLVLVVSVFVYIMTNGAETRQIFLSTEGVADMKKPSEAEILMEYRTDDFYAYFIRNKNDIQAFAMIKKIGLWVYDYPSTKNLQKVTSRESAWYYYDFVAVSEGDSVRFRTPQGDKLEPVMQRKERVGAQDYLLFVFRLERGDFEIGDYALEILDASQQTIVDATAGLESARFTLLLDELKLEEFAKRKVVVENGENRELWPEVFLATNRSLQEAQPSSLMMDLKKLPHAKHVILAEIDRGRHLTFYSSKEFYVWQELVRYRYLLDSDQGAVLVIVSPDYKQMNGFDDIKAQDAGLHSRILSITNPDELLALFKIFQSP